MDKPEIEGQVLYEIARAVKFAQAKILRLNEEEYSNEDDLRLELQGLRRHGNTIIQNSQKALNRLREV